MSAALAIAYQTDPDEDPAGDPGKGGMPFLEHLEELRKRIGRSCIAIGAGMLVAFLFLDRIVAFVLSPTRQALPAGAKLIYTNPSEAFRSTLTSRSSPAHYSLHRTSCSRSGASSRQVCTPTRRNT